MNENLKDHAISKLIFIENNLNYLNELLPITIKDLDNDLFKIEFIFNENKQLTLKLTNFTLLSCLFDFFNINELKRLNNELDYKISNIVYNMYN